tara:strand:+ start:32470 stop:33804 length:1335 start_codon:yes stop_codon:yes gene_type:complete
MNYLNTENIIVAQCTAEGYGAINIIRISGASLGGLYRKIVKEKGRPRPNSILFKSIYIKDEKVDDAMISFFKGPKSFTGEDVIEINCHGGDFIAKKIIRGLSKIKEIRHALPGEFSFRAYYNGKIDVIQAESINSLIKSQTNVHANKSMENIDGQLSRKIKEIKTKIITTSSFCEYGLDVDENEDSESILMQINDMLIEIEGLLNGVLSCNLYSKVVERGIRVAFFGRPNVGKSTLFNSLLGYDRSIVSSVSGTTRDVIEASLEMGGHSIKLIDTAGYRNTSDQIEALGINKTKKEVDKADILICLGENKEDLSLFSELMVEKKMITVLSKCDINKCAGYDLLISSVDGLGFKSLLTELSTKIIQITSSKSINAEYYINDRQQEVLSRLLKNVGSVKKQLGGTVALDIISEYIKKIVDDVDEIVNPIGREEIINNIFSSFCVGK